MIFHWIATAICAFMSTIYNALPPWTINIGFGCVNDVCTPGAVNNGLILSAHVIAELDKFLPMTDAILPMMFFSLTVFLALAGLKAIKFVLSLIPTVSAGG